MPKNRLDKRISKLLTRRVRIVIIDENRLHRLFNRRMTLWRFIVAFAVGVCVVGFIGILVIVGTPLRSFLPGYLYSYERDGMMTTAQRLDSLSSEVSTRNMYVDNIISILNNDIDTVIPLVVDSVPRLIPIDSIITTSEIERDYVKQYEANQRFNISVLTPLAAQGITFVNPMQGAEARFPEEGEDARKITFDMLRLQPVSAVYRGTVLDVYNTLDAGFTVIVQHPNDFISRYSGLTEVMVKRGENVMPGSRLGLIERDKAQQNNINSTFELWNKGAAVNPREYIPF